jgi:hypothetical protein
LAQIVRAQNRKGALRLELPADLEQGIERRIADLARVGEDALDVLTLSRRSGAGSSTAELELGRQDGAEARVGDARRNALWMSPARGNAGEGEESPRDTQGAQQGHRASRRDSLATGLLSACQ